MFDKIEVAYWNIVPLPELPYEHREAFDYTEAKRTEIINTIFAADCCVMMQFIKKQKKRILTIWIDKYSKKSKRVFI